MDTLPIDIATTPLVLDKKDRRILTALARNMRKPLTQIAREVGLSRQSVEYRIVALRKARVLVGSRTVINLAMLGYQTYHIFINPRTPTEEQDIITRAKSCDAINAIIRYTGRASLELSFIAQNPSEFTRLFEEFFAKLSVDVSGQLIIIQTLKSETLPASASIGTPKHLSTIRIMAKTHAPTVLDRLDIQLMDHMSDDALCATTQLARELDCSSDTVIYRLKKLMSAQYVLEFRPVLNYAALGYVIHTLLLKVSGGAQELHRLELYLKESSATLWAAKTFGDWNYIVFIISQRMEDVHDFVLALKSRFAPLIREYEALYAYREYKYSYYSKRITKELMKKT